MRTSRVVTFVLGVSFVVSSVEAQLTPDQARQIAARVRRNPNLTVSTTYGIVDLLEEVVPAPDPLRKGPFAVVYQMGTKEQDVEGFDVEQYIINYYTGDVWAIYDERGRQERSRTLPLDAQLSRDQCYAIALDFVRQRFPNFDQRNMTLVDETARTLNLLDRSTSQEYVQRERIFIWYEVDSRSGARLMNACSVGVWDVNGEVTDYWEMQRTSQVSPLPTLTEQQAAAIVMDYLAVTYGAEEGDLELLPDEELSLDCQSGLWVHEDEFMTQRLVWRFPLPPLIGVDAHTGAIVFDEGLGGGGGRGGKGRKFKKVPVPRQFAFRPSPYQRSTLVLLVKGWEREPLEVGARMPLLRGRETAVWRRTEMHSLNYPPLRRAGRHYLMVDYFKAFGARVHWKGKTVELVGQRGLVATPTPRWIQGKPYLPARVLEEVALARVWWEEKEKALIIRLDERQFDPTPRALAMTTGPSKSLGGQRSLADGSRFH